MTREEAKELLPIIQAFADGKVIQFRCKTGEWLDIEWLDIINYNKFDFILSPDDYRIKPEPKYRPFKNQEECWNEMHKHPDFGWVKNDIGNIFKIIVIFNDSIKLNECNSSYSELFKTFKFTDGTPFGIKEE